MNEALLLSIRQSINQAKKVLITFKKDYTIDTVASALALSLFLKKLDKDVFVFCEKIEFPPEYYSLPNIEEIKNDYSFLEKSLISIDISKTKIKEFSYNLEKDKLNFFITHDKGTFSPNEIISSSVNPYDLIIVLDTPKLDLLGDIYKNHQKIFQKPIINLDWHKNNEKFGQINVMDLESTSSSEIILKLISYFDENYYLDEKIKTILLNGLIADGKNYFVPIKDFNLKLLGKALEKVRNDSKKKISIITLSQDDFRESQSENNDLILLIRGLLNYFPKNELIILVYQNELNKIKVQIISPAKKINILERFSAFTPRGSFYSADFLIENKNLAEAEQLIIEELNKTF